MPLGTPMDRRRIELQIRAVLLTYRIEMRRRGSHTMEAFRVRARSLLDATEAKIESDPELQASLDAARVEIEAPDPSARGALGEEPVERPR